MQRSWRQKCRTDLGQIHCPNSFILIYFILFFCTRRLLRYMACNTLWMDPSCGSPGEGTTVITWHVNQHCMASIRIHQIHKPNQTDRGSSDKWAALRLIHLFGCGEVWSKESQKILIRLPLKSSLRGADAAYTSTSLAKEDREDIVHVCFAIPFEIQYDLISVKSRYN